MGQVSAVKQLKELNCDISICDMVSCVRTARWQLYVYIVKAYSIRLFLISHSPSCLHCMHNYSQ